MLVGIALAIEDGMGPVVDVRGPIAAARAPHGAAVFDVIVLDADASAAFATTAGEPARSSPGAARIVARREPSSTRTPETATTATAATGDEIAIDRPPANPLFDMRKGRPVRLTVGLPTGRWDGRARPPDSFGPDIDSGQLERSGGGTHRSDQGTFTAKVAPDGSVALKDKRNTQLQLGLPSKRDLGDLITSWYEDPDKPVGFLGKPTPVEDRIIDRGNRVPTGGVIATFDVGDALMRGRGQDPYASRKLKFLDATRDQRVQIGSRHRQQQLAQAPQLVQRNLERLWATVTDPAARRTALCEIWDEVAETGSADLVDAGHAARLLIIGFIRARLPSDSPHAYPAADIAACNARKQSSAAFAPYQ